MQNSDFDRALDAHFDRMFDEQCDALDERGGEEGIDFDCDHEPFEYDNDWH